MLRRRLGFIPAQFSPLVFLWTGYTSARERPAGGPPGRAGRTSTPISLARRQTAPAPGPGKKAASGCRQSQ
jgi:hypothetical protein